MVRVINAAGTAPIVFACEHAANRIPDALGTLGLSPDGFASHVAWDLGAWDVARDMAMAFDAPLVACRYSRLVYDCNRPDSAADAVPERSETYQITGNLGLDQDARRARYDEFYIPFRDTLAATIDKQAAAALVTIHSFTPTYFGVSRAVQLGVLHDDDTRLADAVLAHSGVTGLRTERNAPYGPDDGVTHTLRTHALPRGLPNVMLEVRNDLIDTATSRSQVAASLVELLQQAFRAIGLGTASPAPAQAKG